MLNIRFIIKMLGMMFILETLYMLAATASDYEPMNIRPGAGKGC